MHWDDIGIMIITRGWCVINPLRLLPRSSSGAEGDSPCLLFRRPVIVFYHNGDSNTVILSGPPV